MLLLDLSIVSDPNGGLGKLGLSGHVTGILEIVWSLVEILEF
jgi:hypothetical protein